MDIIQIIWRCVTCGKVTAKEVPATVTAVACSCGCYRKIGGVD